MFQRFGKAACLASAALVLALPALGAAETAAPAPTAADWAKLAKLPDWGRGVWQIDWQALFAPGGRPTPPSLTPEYDAKLKAFQASQKQGENVQNQNANCIPPGVPQIMQMPYPLEFLFTPGRVTIAIETDSQVRRIYTDGRKHPDDPDLTFNGDSIGHWEGDTLVVDTIALEPHIEIAPGVGHSDQTRVTERIRQTGPDKLEIATTIEDPKVLTKPWTVTRPYIRHADWQIEEYVCEQNNHDSADAEGRAGFRLDNEAPAPASTPAAPSH
jgi:hypothetical protein